MEAYMKITYEKAASSDIECLYQLCKQLIDAYENIECIDYERALRWVRKKLENSIDEYTSILMKEKRDITIFTGMEMANTSSTICMFFLNFRIAESELP